MNVKKIQLGVYTVNHGNYAGTSNAVT